MAAKMKVMGIGAAVAAGNEIMAAAKVNTVMLTETTEVDMMTAAVCCYRMVLAAVAMDKRCKRCSGESGSEENCDNCSSYAVGVHCALVLTLLLSRWCWKKSGRARRRSGDSKEKKIA